MRNRGISVVAGVTSVLALAGCGLRAGELAEPPANEHSQTAGNPATGGITHGGDPAVGNGDPATGKQEVERPSGERPAFHFHSGDLELGDFVYEDVKDNLFDPCKEISAEEFRAIGFESNGRSQYIANVDGWGCGLTGGDLELGYVIGATPVNRSDIEASGINVEDDASAIVPGSFLYKSEDRLGVACIVSVGTKRGQLSVVVGDLFNGIEPHKLCSPAVRILEDLYQL